MPKKPGLKVSDWRDSEPEASAVRLIIESRYSSMLRRRRSLATITSNEMYTIAINNWSLSLVIPKAFVSFQAVKQAPVRRRDLMRKGMRERESERTLGTTRKEFLAAMVLKTY